ncbi:MAG: hypothetical protein WCO56_28220 [Verrucomicrobiota bacterium]
MKKKLLVIGAVIGVLVMLGMVVTMIFLDSIVKKGVETVGPQITKTDVKLGAVNLSIFSGSSKLKDFVVGNPQGFAAPSVMQVGEMKVAVEVGSLLKEVIVVNELILINPEITFEGNPLGANNFDTLMKNVEAATGAANKPADQPKEKATGASKKIKIHDLTIKGVKVNVNLTGLANKTMTLTMPDIHMKDIGTDNNGATVAEASKQIFAEISRGVLKAVTDSVAGGGKLGKDTVENVGKNLKSLFRK